MKLEIALPKGHLQETVFSILDLAGYKPKIESQRSYFIRCADPEIQLRIHRAQNIGPLVEEGVYDLGITGLDWIKETDIHVKELLDLGVGTVSIVAAVPQSVYPRTQPTDKNKLLDLLLKTMRSEGKEKMIVVSEYENIVKKYCRKKLTNFPYRFITSYGATETFINVADMIVDCTQTGSTLRDNGWEIIDTLFSSTARIIANYHSFEDKMKRVKIDDFLTLVKGALDAQHMRLLKMNVSEANLKKVISNLPAMKSPTLSKLFGEDNGGYALEVAIRDDDVLKLIPLLKKNGATDILEIDIKRVIK